MTTHHTRIIPETASRFMSAAYTYDGPRSTDTVSGAVVVVSVVLVVASVGTAVVWAARSPQAPPWPADAAFGRCLGRLAGDPRRIAKKRALPAKRCLWVPRGADAVVGEG
jgi:hypothetical protein